MTASHASDQPLPHGAEIVWLPTAEEMAELDRRATGSGAITERALIESAGRELAHAVQRRLPDGRVLVLAGSGHNGADALVAARTLAAWGREVLPVLCGSAPPEPDVLGGWGIRLHGAEELDSLWAGSAVVVDGMLGTGVSGPPRDPVAGIIRAANASRLPIVAVDGPSGADFTTGAVEGDCVRARLTVSLGWPKLGLVRFPAREYCGDIVAVEIGFPPPEAALGARAITDVWVASLLAPRSADAHKGEAGYLALAAGQEGMAGASVLAARGAIRGGVGIVRLIGDPANREIVQKAVPEAIFVGWDDVAAVKESVSWADAVAVGPGLGGEDRKELVAGILRQAERESTPAVLDADGLNAWTGEAAALAERLPAGSLVTPHPGELARLMDLPIKGIVADPPAAATRAAETLGSAVLLKGSPSLVAEAGAPLRVSTSGDAALATGGVGDVLTGLVGAYLAAGMGAADSASAALHVSGIAAMMAPEPVGHAASDLPEHLPLARARLGTRAPVAHPYLFVLPAPRGVTDLA